MNARPQTIAERAVKPMTLAQALDAYEKDISKRRSPSETSRRQAMAYASKAVASWKLTRLLSTGSTSARLETSFARWRKRI